MLAVWVWGTRSGQSQRRRYRIAGKIFIQQIQIANQSKSPIVIHCVRAFDRMLRLRKRYGETPWVVHGFVRNKTLAGQVLDSGMYISVAPHEN